MTTGRKQPRTWTGKPPEGVKHDVPGAAPGTFLSDFALPNLDGQVIRISDQVGHPYIFIFVDEKCGPSQDLLRELSRLRKKPGRSLPKVLIAWSGSAEEARATAARLDLGSDLVVQERQELYTFYRIPATPSAYQVDETRRTVGTLAVGKHDAIGILRGKRDKIPRQERPGNSTPVQPLPRTGLAAGSVAPEIVLSAPEGYSLTLSALRGRRVLLLFWSESCPHCSGIIESVAAMSAHPDAPVAFIVGRDGDSAPALSGSMLYGTQEKKHAFDAYRQYQTPAAVLIDRSGHLEQTLAAGQKDVTSLIGTITG